jgi:cytochrome c biogenesis protein CcmG/thiol:disulfide interchange protein DsbE
MKPASVLRFAALAAFVGLLIYGFSPRFAAKKAENAAGKNSLAFDLPEVGGGGQWSLSAQRGNIVLVNFWATWCPPCNMETPGLVALSKRYENRGVKFVGISMDDDPAKVVPAFVKKYDIPYPMLAPTPDFQLAYSIESLPTSMLIDRNGHVARTYVGMVDEQELGRDIDRLLAAGN